MSLEAVYAKTLFELSQKENSVEKNRNDLNTFCEALRTNKKAFNFFLNSHHCLSEKAEALVDQLFKSSCLKKTIKFILSKNRFSFIFKINAHYKKLCLNEKNSLEGKVFFSKDLEKKEKKEIEEKLEKIFKKKILLDYQKTKDDFLGIKIKVGNFLIDDSLQNQLLKLKTRLLDK